jgi:pimeloyl-ACP methyl ester carboxylesterase
MRLIVPDRPGFGRTDPYTDKGFHSWDDDYVTLVDHLELDSATLMGFSGGGGYALAVAAAVPERVSKLVLACAMIPGAPRDTLRRRIKLVSALYFAANWAPRVAGAMLAGTGVFSKLRSDSVSIWPAADQAVMTDEVHRPALQLDSSEGIAQGGSAGVVDLARYRHEVPGLFQSISVPTVFLHGTDDGNVPIEVARWAHSLIPDSRFEEINGGGHLFVVADPTPLLRALA